MTTLESNKLIAEFMGLVSNMDGHFTLEYDVIFNSGGRYYTGLELGTFKNVDLKFRSSWDWLIPVIDKITSLDIYQKYKDEKSSMLTNGEIFINTKYIENTYEQVVDFVKWYNKTTELCHITTNQYLY